MKRVEIFLDDSRFKLERKLEGLINRPGVRVIAISLSESERYYSVLVCYEEDDNGNV